MQKKILYLLAAIIIIAVAAILILLSESGSSSSAALVAYDNKIVPQYLLAQLSVPNNVSNAVNATQSEEQGIITNMTNTAVKSPPMYTSSGKPIVLYIGAEYCPFCAAERWAMVIALKRFGTFTGLRYMTSGSNDVYPNTPTFTFYNSTYTSSYIRFVPVELTTNNGPPYTQLQTPNASQNSTMSTLNPSGAIPFIDIANISVQVGANYNPGVVFAGATWNSTASELSNPQSLQAKSIVAAANLFTAQICKATNNTPQSVCGQPYVAALEKA
ncbi:MAG: DUF929 domain-containing protein [Candidatus Marsarchaeota archaeon]|nr:DUF929 domain-containing protein [Candidatus Marsarchaeota archaeon]